MPTKEKTRANEPQLADLGVPARSFDYLWREPDSEVNAIAQSIANKVAWFECRNVPEREGLSILRLQGASYLFSLGYEPENCLNLIERELLEILKVHGVPEQIGTQELKAIRYPTAQVAALTLAELRRFLPADAKSSINERIRRFVNRLRGRAESKHLYSFFSGFRLAQVLELLCLRELVLPYAVKGEAQVSSMLRAHEKRYGTRQDKARKQKERCHKYEQVFRELPNPNVTGAETEAGRRLGVSRATIHRARMAEKKKARSIVLLSAQ